jgi:CheY-like chemotaxis protein
MWAALAVLACLPAFSQTRLSLEDLGARELQPDYLPQHRGERVVVRGVVSAPAFHFPEYTLLAIQAADRGGVLRALKDDSKLDAFVPGDEVEAEGTVVVLTGMPVLAADRIGVAGRAERPVPIDVPLESIRSFPGNVRFLGRLVRVAGLITEASDTTAGGQVLVGTQAEPFKLFIPSASGQPDLSAFTKGRMASATGVALQFCPLPPFDHFFELLVANPAGIEVATPEPLWPSLPLSPLALAAGLSLVLLVSFFLWSRERRLRKQRERLRKTYQLGEEILSAPSASAILKRISAVLPGILGVTRVQLYVYNRAAKTLDSAPEENGAPVSISLSSPPAGTQAGAVACFSYRTLLTIPDIDRSPFPIARDDGVRAPKSLLFVPMLAQGELVGVLELDQDDRARDFTSDEQALAQHLGNQIGVAIRLQDQRSVQEQLFRTEKLAAVGRLISGIANELQTPLSSISELAAKALGKAEAGVADREVSAIASEVRKVGSMVARLVAFGGSELVEARPVCVSSLLRDLIEFREGDWKASGIRIIDLISPEPLFMLGSQGQLEQVFLNLLVHAEQSLAEAAEKAISIRTIVLNKRLVVEIAFSAPPESHRVEETASLLGVTRSVIAGHGGEVRLVLKNGEDPCFEVEFPVAQERGTVAAASAARDPSRRITAMVIEPDEAAQRQLSGLLTAQGCRVIPLDNADAGLELAQRMHFDLAFCSVHAPGLNWVELSERMQSRVGGFALLSDRYDAELSADFEGPTRFVLPKPVQEPDLERVLYAAEQPHGVAGYP